MSSQVHQLSSSQRAKRLVLLGVAGAVFILAARQFGPFRSSAAPEPSGSSKANKAPATLPTPATPAKQLGQLVGKDLRVVVHATPEGPLYSVVSKDGEVLAANLTETEVGQQFPGLEIETMTADTQIHRDSDLPDR